MSASPEILKAFPSAVFLRVPGVGGQMVETPLPLADWHYQVTMVGDTCRVLDRSTDRLIYVGPGPVEIVSPPVPF